MMDRPRFPASLLEILYGTLFPRPQSVFSLRPATIFELLSSFGPAMFFKLLWRAGLQPGRNVSFSVRLQPLKFRSSCGSVAL
jgi:hypothetical protein